MSPPAPDPTPPPNRRKPDWRQPRVRVVTLMLLVAGAAVVTEAWKYYRDNADPERAAVTLKIRELAGPDPGGRASAAIALGQAPRSEYRRAARALMEAMSDSHPLPRSAAAETLPIALARAGDTLLTDGRAEVDEAGALLLALLNDPDPRCRAAAANGLGRLVFEITPPPAPTSPPGSNPKPPQPVSIRPDPDRVLAALARAARDPNADVRSAAYNATSSLVPWTGDAPEWLLEALETETDKDTHFRLLLALARPWRDQGKVFLAVARALRTRPPAVDLGSYYPLMRLGPAPPESVPDLLALIGLKGIAPDPQQARQLKLITGPAFGALVTDVLDAPADNPPDAHGLLARYDALRALATHARGVGESDLAFDALATLATGPPREVLGRSLRDESAAYLRTLRANARPALPRLDALARDPESPPDARRRAAALAAEVRAAIPAGER